MYFDEDDVRNYVGNRRPRGMEYDGKNPGVAFLWIKVDGFDLGEITSLKAFRPLQRPREPERFFNEEEIEGILDLFLRDADEHEFVRIPPGSRIENRDAVAYILQQDIVMEHSPPFSISFKALLDYKNSPMWIGTFVGAGAAWDHPVLLMITVPGGIIAVSSALGIGNAMQAGLNKSIKRLFDRKP